MGKLWSLLAGIVVGFLAAHFANKTTAGRSFFAFLNQAGKEICDAVASGYAAEDNDKNY